MDKKRKILFIVTLSVLSAVVTYFAGGVIATKTVTDKLLNVRGSTVDSLNTLEYKIQKNRDDYPSLEIREELSFKCDKETLRGYLYTVDNPIGVVITAHGINTLADAHGQLQDYFIQNNYNVFSFDMTGCGASSGKGMKTLHESRKCVSSAIKTVKNNAKTSSLPIFLVGHSWGGYAVVAATEDHKDISAVASFSGYNQPADAMYGFAEYAVGKGVVLTKPSLDFSLTTLYGNDEWFKASTAIKHNPNTKYVIVQGEDDIVVPLKRYSIYTNVNEKKLTNTTKILLPGIGHSGPWREKASHDYSEELNKELDALRKQYGYQIPHDVEAEFISKIDKEKSSQLNLDLMNQINDIFKESISSR